MNQVLIIADKDTDRLEREINKWISKYEVINIQQSIKQDGSVVVTILYKSEG